MSVGRDGARVLFQDFGLFHIGLHRHGCKCSDLFVGFFDFDVVEWRFSVCLDYYFLLITVECKSSTAVVSACSQVHVS